METNFFVLLRSAAQKRAEQNILHLLSIIHQSLSVGMMTTVQNGKKDLTGDSEKLKAMIVMLRTEKEVRT